MNNNEKIPQLSVTSFESYAESELEAGGTHITEGIVSISVMNDPNSASSNSNPLNGPILNELLSKSHEIVVSPDLSLKKIYGYNSSEIVTPVRFIFLLISLYFKIFCIEKNLCIVPYSFVFL